ncbi:MAG: ATP-dependent Clp protease ATP-binding subunit [Candidatus Schekmanbacteria bacterium]|nr:ATP-dependent Clp protease ATP-binding subunit [Candidatus Schekmanbacteria bacterium]
MADMFERFSHAAKEIINLGREEADRNRHAAVGVEHLLFGILKERSGDGARALKKIGANPRRVLRLVHEKFQYLRTTRYPTSIPFTTEAKQVLELSLKESAALVDPVIGPELLLYCLLKQPADLVTLILREAGVDPKEAITYLEEALPRRQKNRPAKSKTPTLDTYSRDLTELARKGKLDPVIGREDEIERMTQILGRRKKNNPVLIGEPGVGKTALVEGFAQRVVDAKVPAILENKRVVMLDLPGLVAGTQYRGQFEERLQALIKELVENPDVVVFIDELHMLLGAGSSHGSLDASNIFKPPLSRGEMQCIGATTLDEYRKYVEADGALERRFQVVKVAEPSVEEAIAILNGLRPRYAEFHAVTITVGAIEAAVRLSQQYISERCLPDKAIDVLDEACAKTRLRFQTPPPALRKQQRDLYEMSKTAEMALDAGNEELAEELFKEENTMRSQFRALREEWIELSPGTIVVSEAEVAQVVSQWTGVPIKYVEESEADKLLRMESIFQERLIGQREATEAIARSIRRSRSGLKNPRKPIGSFLFLGPTGVGKTELALALAEFLFNDEKALIRLDMSEFMEQHTMTRIVGAAPGYVGYGEGGQLTEKVRRRPYSVVLLDEIEKAHPQIFNLMLQVLDDGHLTDGSGRRIDFRNTVIIMTSNLGTEAISADVSLGFSKSKKSELSYHEVQSRVMEKVKRHLAPEFINRLDEIIVFHSLGREELLEIVDLEVKKLNDRLGDTGLKVILEPSARTWLLDQCYKPKAGARPIRGGVQKYLEDPIADRVLAAELTQGQSVRVSLAETGEALDFHIEATPPSGEPAVCGANGSAADQPELRP